MADGNHEGDAGDTDELLYTDLNDNSNEFAPNPPPLKVDPCDFLLDAIDAKLRQLQVQNQEAKQEPISIKHNGSDAALLSWSQSVSKDTGLGSTIQTSGLDLDQAETQEQTPENIFDYQEGPTVQRETEQKMEGKEKEEGLDSRREQCLWRLQRLLGDTTFSGEKMAGELHPPSDSVCTEDFVRRFREEMVGLPLTDRDKRPPDNEEKNEISEDTHFHNDKDRDSSRSKRRGKSEKLRSCDRDKEKIQHQQRGKQGPREGAEERPYDSCRMKMPDMNKRIWTGERYRAPEKIGDYTKSKRCLPAADKPFGEKTELSGQTYTVSDLPCSGHGAEGFSDDEGPRRNESHSPKARSLAGVPMWSFDTVSIDSDLDTIYTHQVRRHIHRRQGWQSVIQSIKDMDGLCTDQSDYDTTTQESGEPQNTSVLRGTPGNVRGERRPSVHKTQHNRRDIPRFDHFLGDDDEDTDEGQGHRLHEATRGHKEKIKSDWQKMEEQLAILLQKCEKEEEQLRRKKTQLCEAELSLSEVQQKREHALQELEQLRVDTARMERERQSLDASLRDGRAKKDTISCQLCKLQRNRDSFFQEVRGIEEEPGTLYQHRITLQDGTHVERTRPVVSVLEREEIERQLDAAKKELFAEQRRSRDELDSMEEKLQVAHEELQRVKEEERLLRNRCAGLEEKWRHKQQQMEALECRVSELQEELGEWKVRAGPLQKILAQKELKLLGFQEEQSSLQVERERLQGEIQTLKHQHCTALKGAQEKKTELEQLNKDLALAYEQQIQKETKVCQQAEEEKANALRDQTVSLTQQIESMRNSVKIKEGETRKLRESLERQKEVMQKREEEMHADALERVHKAVELERREWEAEKIDAIREHCEQLEEQNRVSLERTRSEMEREKRNVSALHNKVVELQIRVQELEGECSTQRREQAMMCQSLKEEHRAELQRLHQYMEQEGERKMMKLQQTVQVVEEEANKLRGALGESDSSHKQAEARRAQQLSRWGQELGEECQHLHLILQQSGARGSILRLPHSPTVAEAVKNLQTLRPQLQQLISSLQQELDSQKRATLQLSQDKERELCMQREQVEMERNQALDCLKERLIQQHIEELSSLNWAQISEGRDEGGGVATSLRRQLQAKDQELRQVQRSMGQWKEQTAACLARKFEEELTTELERKTLKTQELKRRKPQKLEEVKQTAMDLSDSGAQCSVVYQSFHAGDSVASPESSDMTSYKLLRHLQCRVKQLRAENQAFPFSPSPLKKTSSDLSGSYLETVNAFSK